MTMAARLGRDPAFILGKTAPQDWTRQGIVPHHRLATFGRSPRLPRAGDTVELEPRMNDHVSPTAVDALADRLAEAVSDATTGAAPPARRSEPGREPGTALVLYREDRNAREKILIGLAIAAAALPIIGYSVFQHSSPTAFFSAATSTLAGERAPSGHAHPVPPSIVGGRRPAPDPSPPVSGSVARMPVRQETAPQAEAADPAHKKPLADRHGKASRSGVLHMSDEDRTRRLNLRELHRIVRHRGGAGRPGAHGRNKASGSVERTSHSSPPVGKPATVERDNSAQAYADDAAITRRLNLREQQRERRRDRR
jgi:hypothetical protein